MGRDGGNGATHFCAGSRTVIYAGYKRSLHLPGQTRCSGKSFVSCEATDAILGSMPETSKFIHEILPVGMLQCNCHIIGDPKTRDALVIDPGDDAERILDIINRHKLRVSAIIITHAHIDHVGGLRRIQQATGAPVRIHPDDLELYRMLDVQAAWIGCKTPEKVEVDELLREGDAIRWGRFEAQVLHTPGHTQGSVCLYIPAGSKWSPHPMPADMPEGRAGAVAAKSTVQEPSRLFAGDTLFAGSIGRTDLWGGSFEAIIGSLKGKVLQLPDHTIVYPGHGPSTTIGEERETNPFLAGN
jgi:hydroxyacylglutathione hydrolase